MTLGHVGGSEGPWARKTGFTIRKRLGKIKIIKVIRNGDKSEGSSYCVKLFKKYKETK